MIINTSKIKFDLKAKIKYEIKATEIDHRLIIVLIGDDLASKKYTQIKKKIGAKLGVKVDIINLKKTVKFDEVQSSLENIINNVKNENSKIGLIFQLPIKEKLWSQILEYNFWKKNNLVDVDLLHPSSKLKTDIGSILMPPTIGAIFEIINTYCEKSNPDISIIGQGRLVGNFMAKCSIDRSFTVHSFNEFSKRIPKIAKQSDIIVSAASTPGLVDYKYINKFGQLIIDASTSEDNNVLVGDLDLISISNYIDSNDLHDKIVVCKSPGGIGPITVLKLFYNLVFSRN